MISISTNHVVSWPTPASPGLQPVSNVAAVQPVRESARDGQTGLGAGRDGQTASVRVTTSRAGSAEREVPADAAPLLPRSYGRHGAEGKAEAPPVGGQAEAVPQEMQDKTEEARQAAAQQADEKAAAADRPQLQAVLTTVWQASAAVVERALGRLGGAEGEVSAVSGEAAGEAAATGASVARRALLPPAVTQPPVEPLPWPVMPEAQSPDAPAAGAPVDIRPVEDVVAYDEHGNSSWAPLEAGSLISQRV